MYYNYPYELYGNITFDPINLTKKHVNQSEWKTTAIVLIDNLDFCKYYCWFIKKRYNLELQFPQRGLHFTVINDKVSNKEKYNQTKDRYNNTIINLKYNINPRTDGKYWWFDVKSEDAEAIRISSELEPKPYWGFHLTIGRADGNLRIEHSKYIHDLILKNEKTY